MLVSIIVPFYNIEPYFRRCLDSIVNQTYQDLEIILVNDCSPDNSIDIAHEYARKDSRIKIIEHEENLCQGGARNTGLGIATGQYVWFIDSDDEINGYDAVMKIVQKATEYNLPDIIYFSSYYIDKNKKVIYEPMGLQEDNIYLSNKQAFESFSLGIMSEVINYTNLLNSSPVVKVFRKAFLLETHFSFPIHTKQSEDSLTFFAMFIAQTHLILSNAIYYRYYYIPTSTCNTSNLIKDRFSPMMLTVRGQHNYYLKNKKDISSEVLDIFLLVWLRISLDFYKYSKDKNPSLLMEIDAIFKDMIFQPSKLALKLRSKEVTKHFYSITNPIEIASWLESFAHNVDEHTRAQLLMSIVESKKKNPIIIEFIKRVIKMIMPYGLSVWLLDKRGWKVEIKSKDS